MDLLGRKQILLDLVLDDAVAGFLNREKGERFSLGSGGRGHRVHDRVDALLAELGELLPRLFGAPGKRPRLGDGSQVAIGLGRSGVSHWDVSRQLSGHGSQLSGLSARSVQPRCGDAG